MSLLNMASDGMPNVLLALYRYILANGPTPEAKLIDVCAPDIVCRQERAQSTVNTWAKLGLFARSDTDVRLSPALPAVVRERKCGEATLRSVLRELIFRPENNDPFWGSEGVLAADFTRGLAWCLAMDPLRLHCDGYHPVNQLELETLPTDVEVFRNDTRWNGFKAWAVFLGFGWQAKYPKAGTLIVDPATAIRDTLPAIFAGTTELDQPDFLTRLREQVPVLDGGGYRAEVEGKLKRSVWTAPGAGELSASLSLALLRLKNDEIISFVDRADPAAGRVIFRGRGGRQLESVSHFLYAGERS